MIRKLRWKFVAVCMGLVALVLSAVFGAAYHAVRQNIEDLSRQMLYQVLREDSGRGAVPNPTIEIGGDRVLLPYFTVNIWGDTAYITGGTYANLENTDTLREILSQCLEQGAAEGTVSADVLVEAEDGDAAMKLLSLPEQEARAFADAIMDAKRNVTLCPVCQNLTAGGLCPICADQKRDDATICVVADPRDVIAIERSREYRGRYHVLHGVLSPMNHVGPDDLHIRSLLDRVAQGGITEVIMATNPDTEGEATALYIARLLKPFGVKVTRLAYGIPVGGHLEFADDATLMRALEGRREL